MKTSLLILVLAMVACFVPLVWLVSRPDKQYEPEGLVAESGSNTSGGPAFEVHIIMPRSGLPLGGILPDWVVKKFDGTPSELRFDHTSPGAQIGGVAPNHLELRADGWEFVIDIDTEGRLAPETRLVFPLGLGGTPMRLSCRPADPGIGNLHTTTRAGSDELSGSFLVELAICKNAESGKTTNWPPAPLTVRGSFVGPATRPSLEHGPKIEVSPAPSS